MSTLGIDFETFSTVDIAKCGSYRYMDDPAFEILLMAYAYDDDEPTVVDLASGEQIPPEVLADLTDPWITKTAWNCAFERNAIRVALGIESPAEQWEDTMILAGVCGLPMSLAGASAALKLKEDEAKMKEGKALIKYFCTPCKPTKSNGGRTRNAPTDAPEKWEVFKKYNGMDVVAERAIRNRLIRWKPDEAEHKFWCLDAQINERGVRIHRQLAENAVAMDERNKAELTEKAIEITGLENPKSVSQVKAWLSDQEGKDIPSLNKKVIADVISNLSNDKTKEFMDIRADLSKSSTAKYDAMLRSMSPYDDHVRGCFAFYGANRTGRFAGRLVQFQNMSKNYMEDIDDCRNLVIDGNYGAVNALYDGVADPLSQLVRTALIPEEGHKFMISDFSAIEARVIAWLSGERWRLDVFRNGGDIYCMSASQMFKVPVVKHGINGHLRQKGKIAELACIAEGQLVLTDVGLVPIEKVTTDMRVWDGEEWVKHDGVVCNGYREVITYDGLTATPDHLVWVEGKHAPIQFGDAASCGACLIKAGDGRRAVRLGENNIPGKAVEQKFQSLLRPDGMRWLRRKEMDNSGRAKDRKVERLSALLVPKEDPEVAIQETISREKPLRKSEQQAVRRIRGKRNTVSIQERNGRWCVYDRIIWAAGQIFGNRQNRYKRRLCKRESAVCDSQRESGEPKNHGSVGVQARALAVRGKHGSEDAFLRHDQSGDHISRKYGGLREEKKLEVNRKKVAVYDIRNAGKHHRYTVSNALVHNCGYGGGIGALRAFGADKLGMTEEEMADTVTMWREASPNVVSLWWSIERAAIKCIDRHGAYYDDVSCTKFEWDSGNMFMTLPSGRRLCYWGAAYDDSKLRPGKQTISFMGQNQMTKKWERIESYGPKLVENLTQATARDCLRESMMRLNAAGYDIRAHVHDEVIVTEPIDSGRTVEDMSAIMGEEIPWAKGLPLRADGYEGSYYFKD